MSATATKEVVTIKQADAVAAFTDLGYETAAKWSRKKVMDALSKIGKVVGKATNAEPTQATLELLALVKDAKDAGDKIVLEVVEGEKPAKKSRVKAAERNGKAPKMKKEKKERKSRERNPERPGVCQVIEECLSGASGKEPITKQAIMDTLVKRFPDRDRDSMKNSVNTHVCHLVGGRFKDKGRLVIGDKEKGYWMKK